MSNVHGSACCCFAQAHLMFRWAASSVRTRAAIVDSRSVLVDALAAAAAEDDAEDPTGTPAPARCCLEALLSPPTPPSCANMARSDCRPSSANGTSPPRGAAPARGNTADTDGQKSTKQYLRTALTPKRRWKQLCSGQVKACRTGWGKASAQRTLCSD